MRDWAAFVRARLSLPDHRAAHEQRVVRELATQLGDAYEEARARGMSPDEADAFARDQIGDWDAFAAALRDASPAETSPRLDRVADRLSARDDGSGGWRTLVSGLGADLLCGVRAVRARPAFAAAVVLTLALGIGATTALFGLFDALFLRPLPVPAPNQLVELGAVGRRGPRAAILTYPGYRELVAAGPASIGWFATELQRLTTEAGGIVQRSHVEHVTASYFRVLGLTPAAGRFFAAGDDTPGAAAPMCVISHALWRTGFGGDPAVVGKTITIERHRFAIIGVAPPRYAGLRRGVPADVWVTLAHRHLFRLDAMEADWDFFAPDLTWLSVYGRLTERSSLEQAQVALQAAARRIFGTEPNARSPRVILRPAGLGQMGTVSALERPLLILSAAGGLVLLVVCTNVAGLLLVGGSRRRREMATRLAQGAPRVRLVRQLLVETLVLALAGGAAGLLLARATASILGAWGTDVAGTQAMSGGMRLAIGLSLDGRWLAGALLLSIAAALASGLVPALTASRVNIVEALKGVEAGPRGARWRPGFKRLLVVAQIAASVVLVSVSGLLLRSFLNLSAVPLGFRTEGLATATIQGPPGVIDGPGGEALMDDLVARVRAIPGVRSASLAQYVPVSPRYGSIGRLRRLDVPATVTDPLQSYANEVWPGFFASLGIPLLRGRDFGEIESRAGIRPAIVNRALAEEAWPGQDPIGKRLALPLLPGASAPPRVLEVIGMVDNGLYRGTGDGISPDLFLFKSNPLYDRLPREMQLVVASSNLQAVWPAVTRAASSVAPGLACVDVETLDRRASRALDRPRSTARLFAVFAGVALTLASAGLYGLLAFVVASRTREIGIRIAIGAWPGEVVAGVLRSAGITVGAGLLLGEGGALVAGRAVSSWLFGVRPFDPATSVAVALVLLSAGLGAAWLPARRAARVDPLLALRSE